MHACIQKYTYFNTSTRSAQSIQPCNRKNRDIYWYIIKRYKKKMYVGHWCLSVLNLGMFHANILRQIFRHSSFRNPQISSVSRSVYILFIFSYSPSIFLSLPLCLFLSLPQRVTWMYISSVWWMCQACAEQTTPSAEDVSSSRLRSAETNFTWQVGIPQCICNCEC